MTDIATQVSLKDKTTFHVGGVADFFVEVDTEGDLAEVLAFSHDKSLPITVLGGGSNVLISDEGVRGLVLQVSIGGVEYEDTSTDGSVLVRVGAGVIFDELVSDTTRRNLWGLQNLSGIPGLVGGAIVQNINAYGVTIEEMVYEVEAIDLKTGERRVFSREECDFHYRDSFFKRAGKGKNYVVTRVSLRLSTTAPVHTSYRSSLQSIAQELHKKGIKSPTPNDMRESVLVIRRRIGMLEGMYHSAGSFFKNAIVTREDYVRIQSVVDQKYAEKGERFSPWHWELPDGLVKVSSAFLMECTPYNKTDFVDKKFKGTVGISPLHTLSIINYGDARAIHVKEFSDLITDAVHSEFGVTLESEVCFL